MVSMHGSSIRTQKLLTVSDHDKPEALHGHKELFTQPAVMLSLFFSDDLCFSLEALTDYWDRRHRKIKIIIIIIAQLNGQIGFEI